MMDQEIEIKQIGDFYYVKGCLIKDGDRFESVRVVKLRKNVGDFADDYFESTRQRVMDDLEDLYKDYTGKELCKPPIKA